MLRTNGKINLIIALCVWTGWYIIARPDHAFSYIWKYQTVSLVMLIGSIIAGGTSLGGGAVAFPVFTKMGIMTPMDAKIFSLAIQSIGMTSASVSICRCLES